MKAKAYFEAFNPKFQHAGAFGNKAEHVDACIDLMTAFSDECYDTAKKRNVKTEKALIGVVEEFNDKWNALVSLFEKEYGVSPILRNGFRDMYTEIGKTHGIDYDAAKRHVQIQASRERDLMRMYAKELNSRNG